jgi:hypothetical protein
MEKTVYLKRQKGTSELRTEQAKRHAEYCTCEAAKVEGKPKCVLFCVLVKTKNRKIVVHKVKNHRIWWFLWSC